METAKDKRPAIVPCVLPLWQLARNGYTDNLMWTRYGAPFSVGTCAIDKPNEQSHAEAQQRFLDDHPDGTCSHRHYILSRPHYTVTECCVELQPVFSFDRTPIIISSEWELTKVSNAYLQIARTLEWWEGNSCIPNVTNGACGLTWDSEHKHDTCGIVWYKNPVSAEAINLMLRYRRGVRR